MSGNTVKVFKLFWADQDVEQEAWLRAMAAKGLHLKSLNLACQWTFERGQPADVVYRIDFANTKDVHYNQLLEDAGWQHAAQLTGWQYWRKAVDAGVEEEIFTDDASKIRKFKTVLVTLFLLMLPLLILMISSSSRDRFLSALSETGRWTVSVVLALYIPFMLYAVWRLWKRINASAAAG